RCAIQHAHTQTATYAQYGLPLDNCERIFDAAVRHFTQYGSGTPLENHLPQLPPFGAASHLGWIWSNERTDDIFGQSFRFLIERAYGDFLYTPTDDDISGLANGATLLHALVPSLASSALSHTHLVGCFPNLGRWKGKNSSSQFITGGTIFISQRHLANPWWVS